MYQFYTVSIHTYTKTLPSSAEFPAVPLSLAYIPLQGSLGVPFVITHNDIEITIGLCQ